MGTRPDRPAVNRRVFARLATAAAFVAALVIVAAPAPTGAESSGAPPGNPRGDALPISAGAAHSCAVVASGDLTCWGSGGSGRLGQDDTTSYGRGGAGETMADLDPIALPGTAVAVAAAHAHTCALFAGGDVICWGQNTSGKLGQESGEPAIGTGGANRSMSDLGPIDLGQPATAVAAGRDHSCALLESGDVTCWGSNAQGELGLGDTVDRGEAAGSISNLPTVDLGEGRTATAISAGNRHTCALLDEGSVKCWGVGGAGRLGQDSTADIGGTAASMGDGLPPIDLGVGRYATAIATGDAHTCALLDDGTAKCWGSGSDGRLGQGNIANVGNSAENSMADLQPIELPGTPTQIAAGGAHTCALLAGGDAVCWGNNGRGQLGIGSTTRVGNASDEMGAALQAVPLGASARAIALGSTHSCAVLTDGTAKCWGRNFNGQLGQDSTDNVGEEPGEVAALGPIALGGQVNPVVTTPAPPTGVAWEPSGGSVSVSWTAPSSTGRSAITGYRIQRSANEGLTWSTVESDTGSTATSASVSGPDGPDVRYRVAALNAVGLGVWSIESAPAGLVPLEPGRIVDTRPNGETVDGLFAGIGLRDAGGVLEVDVLGRAGIPDDTGAIVLNVTVNEPAAAGFVTVFPCGTAPPNASNLNHDPGQTIANSVIVKLGDAGRVCFFTDQVSHLIVDVNGAYPLDATFNALEPARLLDTRPGTQTIDGEFAGTGALQGGQEIALPVVGRGGVPAGTEAVVLNVTVNDPALPGFITVYPCGTTRPNASNLNYTTGQTVPNNVIVKVGAAGDVCLFSDQTTNLLVDVNGSFPDDATFDPLDPARLLDTRPGTETADGEFAGVGQLTGGDVIALQVTGRGGVPPQVGAVVLNVTVVDPAQAGFVTVFPCGSTQPNASNINFVAGQTIPNNVIVKVGDGGQVCIFSDQTAGLLADVNGSFPPL